MQWPKEEGQTMIFKVLLKTCQGLANLHVYLRLESWLFYYFFPRYIVSTLWLYIYIQPNFWQTTTLQKPTAHIFLVKQPQKALSFWQSLLLCLDGNNRALIRNCTFFSSFFLFCKNGLFGVSFFTTWQF
jgi:hypothetical protein